MLRRLGALFCGAVLFTVLPAAADQWNKSTTVTFSAPVELPGIVLPAGTYVFKLADTLSDRHVVQVFNADETHIYATILAIPNYRLTPTGKTVIRFEERRRENPEALRAWFYPADNFGQEFVYSKKRGTELAETAKVPVLVANVTPTETAEELVKEPVVAITPERQEVEVAEVTAPAAPPEEPLPYIAKAEPEPPMPAEPVAELPHTASPLPLLFFMGLSSLGLAGAFRAYSKHVS